MNAKPRILLIYTGGTIGSMEDPETGSLRPVNFDELLEFMPELQRLDVHLQVLPYENPKDSSDMRPEDWVHLAKLIEANYPNFDGFVVLHGTDTMAYTASALSFLLENLKKPVILTGSQLPMGRLRTDGKENLLSALEIAAWKEDGASLVQEVAVYFEYKLYRGNRCLKYSAMHFNAYKSPNYPVLAEAGVELNFHREALWRPGTEPFRCIGSLSTDVASIRFFPGLSVAQVKATLQQPGLRALIIETFGFGNGPYDPEMYSLLEEAGAKGLVMVNISQCIQGAVQPGRYATGNALAKIGVLSGHDLTFEAAITKAMYLLGTCSHADEVKRGFALSLAGEQS